MVSAMRLADWLSETGKTQGWLAGQVGVTQGRISQLAAGDVPSLELAAKIEEATEKAVTVHDLLPERAGA
jgi:predicted transcriptional regulator